MEDIKEGSVVQLKSGGPEMTVKFIKDDQAICQWFLKNELKEESFPVSSLRLPSAPFIM